MPPAASDEQNCCQEPPTRIAARFGIPRCFGRARPQKSASRLAARLAIPLVGLQNLQDFSTTLGPRNPASCLATRLAIPRIGLQNLQDFSATLGPGILQILPAARSLSHLHLLGSRLQSTHKRQGCWKTLHAFFLLDKSGYRWIQMQREP